MFASALLFALPAVNIFYTSQGELHLTTIKLLYSSVLQADLFTLHRMRKLPVKACLSVHIPCSRCLSQQLHFGKLPAAVSAPGLVRA